MRARALLTSAGIVAALVAGCLDTGAGPGPAGTRGPDGSSPAPRNEAPIASIRVFNATLAETHRHFVGENVSFSAGDSTDPDGRIVEYSWRVVEDGIYAARYGEPKGPNLTVRFDEPGERTVTLFVEDDEGAVGFEVAYVSVHQHVRGAGQLFAGPVALAGASSHEYRLPVKAGARLLSIEANFTPMELTKVRLEIRLPNGTRANGTDSVRSPAWSVAVPPSGVVGNYTAVIHLLQGAPLHYRLEFVAWYGFGV